jgi:ureidoacrylate peracid hydrolase
MRMVNGVEVFDALEEIVKPAHTALVVVDVQNDCVHPDGWFARNGKDVGDIQQILPRVIGLVEAARAAGVLVVFMEQTTLPGNLSDPPAWLHFKTRDGRTRTDYTLEGSWGQQTIEELKVSPRDVRLAKFRPSAFHGTALDKILRSRGIQSVVTCGVITQGCVQATTMDASFHDYYTVFVKDCVASYSGALHENAVTFLASRYEAAGSARLESIWAQSPSTRETTI